MAATTTTQTEEKVLSLKLKLLVNKKTSKVLLAEAGKDFVDILCSFLTLPLGTIARLLWKESNIGPVKMGCLNSLYQSVENLDQEFLRTVTCKEMLLQPRNSSENYCSTLKLNIDDTEPTKYFMCTNLVCSYRLLSTFKNQRCECGCLLGRSVSLESDKKVCNGFVKDGPTFIVTDDLIVMPNSMDTSIGLLQSFGITTTSSVTEMIVNVTMEKVLDLLKCSLLSNSTLSDLFLKKEPFFERISFSPCNIANNSSIRIKVKLFIRKSDGEILFAQGEEDFADFLFSFLTFPLGGVVHMLEGNCSLGSIDALYKGIADLDGYKYLRSNEVKKSLVDPCIASQFKITKQILPIYEPQSLSYYCYYQRSVRESIMNNTLSITSVFRGCTRPNECYTILTLLDPKSSKERLDGYVKGHTVFVATNDLVVEPMSPILAISFLNRLGTPLSDLTEKVVFIGAKEGLSLLKAALTSRSSALTNGLGHLLKEVKEEGNCSTTNGS